MKKLIAGLLGITMLAPAAASAQQGIYPPYNVVKFSNDDCGMGAIDKSNNMLIVDINTNDTLSLIAINPEMTFVNKQDYPVTFTVDGASINAKAVGITRGNISGLLFLYKTSVIGPNLLHASKITITYTGKTVIVIDDDDAFKTALTATARCAAPASAKIDRRDAPVTK